MSNATEARRLLRSHRYGALSTLSKRLDGSPFGSITPYLTDHDGSLIIHISALAEHTKNIGYDPRVSLITHNQKDPDIQMQGRVTMAGTAHQIPDQPRYLRHFPEAAYLTTLDFSFYRIQPLAIRYIGGVGRVHWLNMEAYFVPQAADFAQHEETLINKINIQQQDTLCRLLLQHHGVNVPDAEVFALDCDGLDIHGGDRVFRLDFANTLTDPMQFEQLSALSFLTP